MTERKESKPIKIGIIGGSGLDDPNILKDSKEVQIETQYGNPSSLIKTGRIDNVDVCILSRHGRNHEIPPSQVNYRANIAALKILGCTHIIATNAVGSLREEIRPGDIVFSDQVIDFTKQRKMTFYDKEGEVIHTGMSEPFSPYLRNLFSDVANELGIKYHKKATLVVIEGPRFSTKAESFMFRTFADIISMTTCPECFLAKEAEIEYVSLGMSTDYDCWKSDEAPVTFDIIKQRMSENVEKVKKLILAAIPRIKAQELKNNDLDMIKNSIRTIPNFPKQGIMFKDITTLLKNPIAMSKVMNILMERYKGKKIDVVAGIESRGFVFGAILAEKLNASFVPIRKKGKLPYEVVTEEYELEYGHDSIEVHKDAIPFGGKVLVVDDLIATGGTACAACKLIEKMGARVEECVFVIELVDLKGRDKLKGRNVFSIVEFEGE